MKFKFRDLHWSCSERGCDEWGAWVWGTDNEGVTRWIPATGDIEKRRCFYHGPSRVS